MKLDTTVLAVKPLEVIEQGDFFRLLSSAGNVDVRFYWQGREVGYAPAVGEGYAEKFRVGQFDRLVIAAAVDTAVSFVTRLGVEVSYDSPPVGDVNVLNTYGPFTQSAITVTNASSLKSLAKSRRYLLIQNKDVSGNLFVCLDGAAASTTRGIKVEPGGSLEIEGYCPDGSIYMIGDIASNANVVIVEA